MSRCIGIFGGTFDPIHNGHLRSAFELFEQLPFDEVRLLPCGVPPHQKDALASSAVRLALLHTAIEGQPGLLVDDRELHRDGPSYSIDTLQSLREEFPEAALSLIIGMDAFLGLPQWHRWEELLDFAHLVVAHRPGWQAPRNGEIGEFLEKHRVFESSALALHASGHIYVHQVTQLEISSSAIRQLLAEGRDPRFLLPESVRIEIQRHKYYTASPEK